MTNLELKALKLVEEMAFEKAQAEYEKMQVECENARLRKRLDKIERQLMPVRTMKTALKMQMWLN